jgi:hypothetical protein
MVMLLLPFDAPFLRSSFEMVGLRKSSLKLQHEGAHWHGDTRRGGEAGLSNEEREREREREDDTPHWQPLPPFATHLGPAAAPYVKSASQALHEKATDLVINCGTASQRKGLANSAGCWHSRCVVRLAKQRFPELD